ncbi:V-type ATP synthase subunit D [Fulvivirga sp. M361]|uniref:V-type ATP synthase subunit D n=1 Tax=Fulvivirga sp. M361 TaxID=2594266 RepID=UPI00117A6C08|nr:V-type ATP synthase subunit D [Fulvivirga sp. M361]TRX60674.1 V-type ATP synthase subunit D [Fulvivirga sp. M361]
MALKFQYNKNALQDLKRQLSIREKALPILKSKETALRHEVQLLQRTLKSLEKEIEDAEAEHHQFKTFWAEFPDILVMEPLNMLQKNVVGVKVPYVKQVNFTLRNMSRFNLPGWIPAGIKVLERIIRLEIETDIARQQIDILHSARKKTTQKVNLYEKVQIPAFEDATIKIKRFLEDKDNISKAAQKIVKKRNERKQVPA